MLLKWFVKQSKVIASTVAAVMVSFLLLTNTRPVAANPTPSESQQVRLMADTSWTWQAFWREGVVDAAKIGTTLAVVGGFTGAYLGGVAGWPAGAASGALAGAGTVGAAGYVAGFLGGLFGYSVGQLYDWAWHGLFGSPNGTGGYDQGIVYQAGDFLNDVARGLADAATMGWNAVTEAAQDLSGWNWDTVRNAVGDLLANALGMGAYGGVYQSSVTDAVKNPVKAAAKISNGIPDFTATVLD